VGDAERWFTITNSKGAIVGQAETLSKAVQDEMEIVVSTRQINWSARGHCQGMICMKRTQSHGKKPTADWETGKKASIGPEIHL